MKLKNIETRLKLRNIEYIKNDKNYGIKYEWNLIRKEFKKLNIPKNVYTPTHLPFEKLHIFVIMSERSVGKTTNFLLLGMIMNKLYGTIIHYVRQRDDEIVPKALKDLFTTILQYDYVSKITNGKYNSVHYNARRWYYCTVDDTGEIIDIDTNHFMFCCSVNKMDNLKSSYNCPTGDIIIFDEFVEQYYYPNEFINFSQLAKTIMRDRLSPIICFLANGTDPNNEYLNELELYDNIQGLKKGEWIISEGSKGTKIYFEITPDNEERKAKKSLSNKQYFGFKNPLLSSITGEEEWSFKNYPHIPPINKTQNRKNEKIEYITQNIYIKHNSRIIRLDLVNNENKGLCIYAHWSKIDDFYDDSYIFTSGEILDSRYHYKFGNDKISKIIWGLYKNNKFYFSQNDVGAFVEKYVQYCNRLI